MTENTDIILVKVQTEEEWAYQRRGERLSFARMSELAALPVEEGGLGYKLSAFTLRTRHDAHAQRMAPIIKLSADERRARQQEELDEIGRLCRIAITKAASEGRVDREAVKLLIDVQKREASLHGLDAALRVEHDVNDNRAVLDELNAALIAMGEEPATDPVAAELSIMLARMPGRRKPKNP